jgi:hypothetical protein
MTEQSSRYAAASWWQRFLALWRKTKKHMEPLNMSPERSYMSGTAQAYTDYNSGIAVRAGVYMLDDYPPWAKSEEQKMQYMRGYKNAWEELMDGERWHAKQERLRRKKEEEEKWFDAWSEIQDWGKTRR